MSDEIELTGICLCKKIRITVKHASRFIGACHCKTCRQWSSAPLLEVDCGTEVEIEGNEALSIYQSSNWAERGFCSQCGTHLFYRLKAVQHYIMPAGLFDGDNAFVFTKQVFIEEKPEYYCFANQTTEMIGDDSIQEYIDASCDRE